MSVNRRNAYTEFSKQQILNDSFDRDYMMLGNEVLVENAEGTALTRQKPIATEAKQDDIIGNYTGGFTMTELIIILLKLYPLVLQVQQYGEYRESILQVMKFGLMETQISIT